MLTSWIAGALLLEITTCVYFVFLRFFTWLVPFGFQIHANMLC